MDILDKQDNSMLCADANGERDEFMSRTLQNLCGTKQQGMRRWPSKGFASTSLEINDAGKRDEEAEDSSGDEDVLFVEEVKAGKGSTIGKAKKVEDAEVVQIDEAIGGGVDADADGSRNAAVIGDGRKVADAYGSIPIEVIGVGFQDAVRPVEMIGDGKKDADAVRSLEVIGDGLKDADAVRSDEAIGDAIEDADEVYINEVIGDGVEDADEAGAGEMIQSAADIVGADEAIGVANDDADAEHLSGDCAPLAKRLKLCEAERLSKGL